MSAAAFVTRFVDRLLFGLVHSQLYGPQHPRVREAATEAARTVGEYGLSNGCASVVLGAVGDQVVFEGRPVLGATLYAKRLLQRVRERGAGGLEFLVSATPDEVCSLLAFLTRRGVDVPKTLAASNDALVAANVHGIRFVAAVTGAGGGGAGGDGSNGWEDGQGLVDGEGGANVVEVHQGTFDLLQDVMLNVCEGRDVDLGRVGATVEELLRGLEDDPGTMHGAATHAEYDYFTFGHSIRVALLALDVASVTVTDPHLLRRIGAAALLHDVGKAFIPLSLLHKPGRLTLEERREVEKHPVLGAGVLMQNRDADSLSVAAAYGHHCTHDGGGYPHTCGEFEQGIVTRLVKICDVYEALTARRPYKEPMTPPQAYRTMRLMKGHFDPTLFDHFLRVVGVYPPGTRVRLDDGSLARVVRQTRDPERPVVQVVTNDDGPVDAGARRSLDLSVPGADPDGRATRVVGLAPEAAPAADAPTADGAAVPAGTAS